MNFPYPYRGDQERMVRFVEEAVCDGIPAVMESGTGTGKTVVSLSGALAANAGTGRKIIYLTRTKSQQRQAITEAARLSGDIPILCVGLQGRSPSTCPMMASDPDLVSGTPEEVSRLCSEFKRKDGNHCPYFDAIEEADIGAQVDYIRNSHPEPEQFADHCIQQGLCPYELLKYALPDADIIVAHYSFIFIPHILERFIQWTGTPLSDMVVIVDEAHNLPDYLRDLLSQDYTARALELTEKEAGDIGDPEVGRGFSVRDIAAAFRVCLNSAMSEFLKDGEEDALIPQSYLREEMMVRLGLPSTALDAIFRELMAVGETVRAQKAAKKKLPRSHIGSFGTFLVAWSATDDETYIHAVMGGDDPCLSICCLDPALATDPLRMCRSSIHMSGTLAPLEEYSAELDLRDPRLEIFKSPFSKENLLSIYSRDVSTKYDEISGNSETYSRLVDQTVSLIKATERNTVVFFPSYGLMDRFVSDGVPEAIGRNVRYERRGMTQHDLMGEVSSFRISKGDVLFAVTGGRISEGLDFPGEELEVVIIVGIPYPHPNARLNALVRYCDYRYGNGWDHAIKTPTMRKMRQAIGRVIRSETDRGVAVILDRRVSAMTLLGSIPSDDVVGEVRRFFS